MEKLSLKGLFPGENRQPDNDEYLNDNDGLIYCKACKTPRQYLFDWDKEIKAFRQNCKCQQAAEELAEKQRKQAEWEARINRERSIGIPNPKYQTYTFAVDDNKTPKTTQACKNFVEKFDEFSKIGGGLILWGNVGTGKTFLAMCIANALIDKGYTVQCTSLAAIVKMAQDFDNAEVHLARLMRKSLIVVDDLGVERGTAFANEQTYLFIDSCNTHNTPIIFTTNHTPKQLTTAAEDTSDLTFARIYSRILEKCLPVKVNEIKRRAENEVENKTTMARLLGVGDA
jgi:DNA replication protein DnaC